MVCARPPRVALSAAASAVRSPPGRCGTALFLARAASTKGPTSGSGASSAGGGPGKAAAGASSSSSSSPSPSPSASPQAKSARDWLIVGATGSVAVAGAWWYLRAQTSNRSSSSSRSLSSNQSPPQQHQRSFSSSARTSFQIPVRDPSNPSQMAARVVTSLTPTEVDARLRSSEASTRVERPPGACIVERYDTVSVPSNDPIEDRRAEVIVERDEAVQGTKNGETKGDLGFFAVMDGHAGYHTSALLSSKLVAFVALELDKVIREAGEYGEIAKAKARFPAKLWRTLFGGPETSQSPDALSSSGLDGDPEIVKRALAKAFRGLDKEIVNRPVELLKEYELSRNAILASHKADGSTDTPNTRSLSSLAQSIFPQAPSSKDGSVYTATQKSAHETMLPALSGSCALLTYVDSARGDVFVACTGDSRAVAGWWDHGRQRWEVEALSKDQTGRNMDEVKRMRAEHPASEADSVIMRGRVLGGLEPTRAFGDARYKWDRTLQERLYDAFLPGGRTSARGPPRGLQTPPYVTAEPVVEWRRLSKTGSAGKELKFIIMATDGLWDMLSNQDAVGLVAAHLTGFRGTIGSTELQTRCFTGSVTEKGSNDNQALAGGEINQGIAPNAHPLSKDRMARFVFEDDNLATHLTRNALGGANRERVAGLLAIPAPFSRRYRDDITVNVIMFNARQQQQQETRAATEMTGVSPPAATTVSTDATRPDDPPKAKL